VAAVVTLLASPSAWAEGPDAGDRDGGQATRWRTVETERASGRDVRVKWQLTAAEVRSLKEQGYAPTNMSGRMVGYRCVFEFSDDSGPDRYVVEDCPSPYPIFSPDGAFAVAQRDPAAPPKENRLFTKLICARSFAMIRIVLTRLDNPNTQDPRL